MGSTSTRKIEGFVSLGGEAPFIDPNDVVIVGLDEPETADNWYAHCSRLADETDADLAEYANDIRLSGKVDEPIDVVRDGDRVVVLDGRRSTRAARMVWAEQAKAGVAAGDRVSVRVLVRRGSPEELFRYNVDSHKKKPLTPMQRARMILKHFSCTGEDMKKTAEAFGVTTQTIKNMSSLVDLAPDVQRAVDKGELPIREAIKLADMPRAEQQLLLTSLKEADATKGARASNGIKAAKKGEKVKNDTRKMRSRTFLEKWRDIVKKDERFCAVKVPLDDVLKFVLGGNIPTDFPERVKESLIEAGFKQQKRAAA
jgi:ParB-like chromosome segregation protein Spo0J